MRTFEETIAFIEAKTIEHDADGYDDWVYETIELAAFTAIIEFSLSEGFSVTSCDLAAFIKKVNGTEDDEDEDEKDPCWQMNEICEEMSALQDTNGLPPKTQELYTFWQRRFWPDFYDESDEGQG